MELWIDTGGSHTDEAWIVGGAAPINVTNSSQRATHEREFAAAGKLFRFTFTGDYVRQAYPGTAG